MTTIQTRHKDNLTFYKELTGARKNYCNEMYNDFH